MKTKLLVVSALTLAIFGSALEAQAPVQPMKLQGPVHRATLDMATGIIDREENDKCGLVLRWANTDWSGYYTLPGTGIESLNWGILQNSSTSTDIVGKFCFAYGTTALDTSVSGPGASMCMTFYDNAVGFCADGGSLPSAQFCFDGLPASLDGSAWTWIVCADLTGGGTFHQDAGLFGYSVEYLDSSTGPLLNFAGGAGGAGYDANGQEDAFDIYTPDVPTGSCGTFWFGGYPYNYSSWHLEMYVAEGDLPADCSWYCGSGANIPTDGYVINSPAKLGGSFTATVTGCNPATVGSKLVAFSSPAQFPSGWGEVLINIADPGGELLNLSSSLGNPVSFSMPVPLILSFCGLRFYTQAVSFGGSICLHCAHECTVGF